MDAYEIRLELLKLAQSIESDRVWTERNRMEQDWNLKREQAITHNWATLPEYPRVPISTHNDVIHVAEELNKFVSNKG